MTRASFLTRSGCAVGNHPTGVEHDEPLAETEHGAEVVLDEEDGPTFLSQSPHEVRDRSLQDGVHTREGLVENAGRPDPASGAGRAPAASAVRRRALAPARRPDGRG